MVSRFPWNNSQYIYIGKKAMESLQIEEMLPLRKEKDSICDSKLVVMALANFVVNTGFSYIVPFYPDIAHK